MFKFSLIILSLFFLLGCADWDTVKKQRVIEVQKVCPCCYSLDLPEYYYLAIDTCTNPNVIYMLLFSREDHSKVHSMEVIND